MSDAVPAFIFFPAPPEEESGWTQIPARWASSSGASTENGEQVRRVHAPVEFPLEPPMGSVPVVRSGAAYAVHQKHVHYQWNSDDSVGLYSVLGISRHA